MYAVAYHHSCEDVGKTIKRSKRRYLWKFGFEMSEYDIENHEVVLYASLLSGKRQLYIDGQKISSSKGQINEYLMRRQRLDCQILLSDKMYNIQYGKLQMKFMIDKHQNSGVIQAEGDLYTLIINDIEFKKLYPQGNHFSYLNAYALASYFQDSFFFLQIVNKFNSIRAQKTVFQDLESDNEELDEDQINHLNLQEERYNNVVSKLRGKNPQLFNGPIIKQETEIKKQGPPQNQFNNRFQSFGVDQVIVLQSQDKNSVNAKSPQLNNNEENQQKDPFIGFNFNSWVKEDDKPKQNTMNFSNQDPVISYTITQSVNQSNSNQINNSDNSNKNNNESNISSQQQQYPEFGKLSGQVILNKSTSYQVESQNINQSSHDKVFDDFFNHNKNKEETKYPQLGSIVKDKGFSFTVNLRNNSEMGEISESNKIQGIISLNNQLTYLNQKGELLSQQPIPQFGSIQQNSQFGNTQQNPNQSNMIISQKTQIENGQLANQYIQNQNYDLL